MNNQNIATSKNGHKKIIIFLLYTGAAFIFLLGSFFSAFAVINNISFQILNAKVPGLVFGLLVAYLGVRYFFLVAEFKIEFLKNDMKFSWSNFKREKKIKKGFMK